MNYPGKIKAVLILSLITVISGLTAISIIAFNLGNAGGWFAKNVGVKFNNALCLTLTGAYYLLAIFGKSPKIKILLYILSSSVIIICALTLAEYIFNVKTGVDQLFVTNKFDIADKDPFPGRIKSQTAFVFLLFGLSQFEFGTNNRFVHILSQYTLHLVSLILAILLIGFLYSGSFLNNLQTYGLDYLYEGALVFSMSVAGTFFYPSLGITGLFTGKLVGNIMARRLFALMAVMIMIFGAVRIKFIGFKLWELDTGLSIFIAAALLAGLLIIWYIGSWLNSIDLKRYKAEKELKDLNEGLEKRVEERTSELSTLLEKLKDSELKFRTLAEKSMVGIYIGRNERFSYVNPRFAEIFGYRPDELINTGESTVTMLISEEGQHLVSANILARQKGEMDTAHYEVKGKKKDGTYNYVEFFGNRVVIDGVQSIIGTVVDITERKRAEEELKSSELKYKLLFESNPQPLWMIAKDDLSIISVNSAAAKLYGYTKEELLNKNLAILRPAEDLTEQAEIFSKDFNTTSDAGIRRHVKKDGSIMFVHVIANDIMLEGRKIRLALTTDVSEKIEAQENLQKSEANLRTILETTTTAYALLDRGFNVIAFNHMAVEFANAQFKAAPQKGGKLTDFFPGERFLQLCSYADEVLSGKNISYETNYSNLDGESFFFNVRMFPIKNNGHEIFGIMLEWADITEIKKHTNAIEEQNKKLREIAWLQSHMARAPLARLMGIVNLLKDNDLDITEHREFLEYLATSANELDTIIKDITDKTVAIK